jgi:YVTN family beta-propeller protein
VTAGTGPTQTVSVIATATNTVVATVPVGIVPTGVAVHPAGTFVYVTNSSSDTVSVIATATNTVVATVPVGTRPIGVAVHPAGTVVYVANRASGTVSVIATATNTVVATVPVGRYVSHVAMHPAGGLAYVTTDTDVSVIDTATHTVVATVAAGDFPFGVAVHPAGSFVYVTNLRSATVSVIATATNTVVATVPTAHPPTTFGQFVGPEHPGASLTLNQATFRPGTTLALGGTTYAGPSPRRLDAYVELRLPDDTRVFLTPDGSFTREVRPLASDWLVGARSGEIFRYTFAGNEPSGSYRWLGYFTEPGTSSIVGPISQAPFAFSP